MLQEHTEKAIDSAKDEETQRVYLDRGINRILREEKLLENPHLYKNRRHDVTILKKDGKIDLREIQSKSDDTRKLKKRMDETLKQLPQDSWGKEKVFPANKDIKLT